MGCDIHLAVETRRNKYWSRAYPDAEARDPWLVEQAQEQPHSYYGARQNLVWYDSRNYDAFAMLANVRNGTAFAGVKTGDGFLPISEPRGLPDDVSEEVRGLLEGGSDADIWLGDHSHSWLTLAELEQYFAEYGDLRTGKRGLVGIGAFAQMVAAGKSVPTDYCSDVWGGKTVKLSEAEARAHLESGMAVADDESVFVEMAWGRTYRECAEDLVTRLIPSLQRMRDRLQLSSDDVRIVFGFDS